MNKSISIFALSLIFLSISNLVYADDHQPVGPAAVEMLACSFNDGKTVSDLNKVVKDWDKWADRKGLNYSAWSMAPFAVSQGMLTFDYIWFGFSPNFETYGNTMENWIQEGEQTIGLKFNEVAKCSPRSLFAVVPARQVDWDQDTTKNNPFQLANCKFRDGKSMADLMKAAGEFNKYIETTGADPLIAIFVPDAGNELDADWDIKVGAGWSNYEEMGKARQAGYQPGNTALQDTWGSVLDCDSPRVYTTNLLRDGDE